jgi:hypothetical protein
VRTFQRLKSKSSGEVMQSKIFAVLLLIFAVTAVALAGSRQWKSGTLTATDQAKVATGSTQSTNTDATYKNKDNRTDYSRNTKTTTSDDYETYQTYTIDAGNKVIVARERLLFPWSKSANVNVGETVKYAIERGKLYLFDDDGKEHKATVVSSSLKTTP